MYVKPSVDDPRKRVGHLQRCPTRPEIVCHPFRLASSPSTLPMRRRSWQRPGCRQVRASPSVPPAADRSASRVGQQELPANRLVESPSKHPVEVEHGPRRELSPSDLPRAAETLREGDLDLHRRVIGELLAVEGRGELLFDDLYVASMAVREREFSNCPAAHDPSLSASAPARPGRFAPTGNTPGYGT